MNIIIAGGGKVGTALTRQLSAEGHDITLIDQNPVLLSAVAEQLDIMTMEGNCASMPVLQRAGVKDAELLIAATDRDEVNLLCCMTAHGINPQLHTIARIRDPEYTEQIYKMRSAFGLSLTVNPERQAAVELERLLKYPGFLRRDTFAKGRAEIVELRIDGKSKLCDLPLSEMYRTVKTRVLVCAVLRSGTAVAPKGDFVLREGDRIFVTAPTESLTVLLKNLGILTRRVRSCMLCGGDRITYYLAQLLEDDPISVNIMERSESRCRELATLLPHASVIQGDCGHHEELEAEGISDYDAVISLTGSDETNMLVSLYAASRDVSQVITKLTQEESVKLADTISLGSVVCPRELCCNTIVRYVRAMQNQSGAAVSVHSIADGQVEAVEFLVTEQNRHCGEPLKTLRLKPDVLIASVTHENNAIVPGGDTCFHPGDTVVVVTGAIGSLRQLDDIFA